MLDDISSFDSTSKIHVTRLTLLAMLLLTTPSCAIVQSIDVTDMKCRNAPKCVSSEELNSSQFIEPLSFSHGVYGASGGVGSETESESDEISWCFLSS